MTHFTMQVMPADGSRHRTLTFTLDDSSVKFSRGDEIEIADGVLCAVQSVTFIPQWAAVGQVLTVHVRLRSLQAESREDADRLIDAARARGWEASS